MATALDNRLRRVEEITGPIARFVVVLVEEGDTVEAAIARETAGLAMDERTLVCVINLLTHGLKERSQ